MEQWNFVICSLCYDHVEVQVLCMMVSRLWCFAWILGMEWLNDRLKKKNKVFSVVLTRRTFENHCCVADYESQFCRDIQTSDFVLPAWFCTAEPNAWSGMRWKQSNWYQNMEKTDCWGLQIWHALVHECQEEDLTLSLQNDTGGVGGSCTHKWVNAQSDILAKSKRKWKIAHS